MDRVLQAGAAITGISLLMLGAGLAAKRQTSAV
jgi:hypothetical protein